MASNLFDNNERMMSTICPLTVIHMVCLIDLVQVKYSNPPPLPHPPPSIPPPLSFSQMFVENYSWWLTSQHKGTYWPHTLPCRVIGEFPSQRSVTRSFDLFYDWSAPEKYGWDPLWRHCNVALLDCFVAILVSSLLVDLCDACTIFFRVVSLGLRRIVSNHNNVQIIVYFVVVSIIRDRYLGHYCIELK